MKNFFEYQEEARRRTRLLIVLYGLAVVGTVLLTYFLVWALFYVPALSGPSSWTTLPVFEPRIFLLVTGVVVLLIGGMTAMMTAELASGGRAVALMLGGREVIVPARDFREKRLLNVVEEMAIASGVPVPPVFIMDEEDGINAFAAGYSPDQAVIGVSRGALEYLNRDELQGVIAHEFSHVLNGDMRLNIRLIAIIFGIMGLAAFGSQLMRSSRGSSRDRGSIQLILLGLGLYLLGIVGAFFGNLIKAMVSRQREFLADASAVQFTRNPAGIGGALKKIGGLKQGSTVRNLHASETAHLFFADALFAQRLSQLFATHPPLPERIRRIDPQWDGTFPEVIRPIDDASPAEFAEPAAPRPLEVMTQRPDQGGVLASMFLSSQTSPIDQAGVLTSPHTAYAKELLSLVPSDILTAVHEPFSARAIIFALLLDRAPEVRETQWAALAAHAEKRDLEATQRLIPRIDGLPESTRLPLVDLAIPALRRLSRQQYESFRGLIETLIAADGRLSLFEYVLRCVVESHLDPAFGRPKQRPAPPRPTFLGSVAFVVSYLAWTGSDDESEARRAFDAAVSPIFGASLPMIPKAECQIRELDRHLKWMARAKPALQRKLLDACLRCIADDGRTTVREAELLRAIADVIGVPMPPLIPDA